jgi:ABC-type uncharacterized transport system involved in gliding motility auxiliary subunit
VVVAAAAFRAPDGAGKDARIVVIGDADIARNGGVTRYFNLEFLGNALLWLSGGEELIAEPAKGLRPSRVEMTEADYRNLFRLGVLLVPEALLIVGIAVWWRRRSL